METVKPEENENNTEQDDLDWENRVLCPDGNCIGVIGQDGRCSECGQKYEGTLPADQFSENESTPAEEGTSDNENHLSPEQELSNKVADTEHDDWESRVLCSDGNCIGVIGADGRCKECGKPYEG